jgi:hypothetical protein
MVSKGNPTSVEIVPLTTPAIMTSFILNNVLSIYNIILYFKYIMQKEDEEK